jgi:50S ribosomal subunit-associated GTPase HflX
VVILCTDASSEELEDEVRTVRSTLAEGAASGSMVPVLCLNKMDLVSESAPEN